MVIGALKRPIYLVESVAGWRKRAELIKERRLRARRWGAVEGGWYRLGYVHVGRRWWWSAADPIMRRTASLNPSPSRPHTQYGFPPKTLTSKISIFFSLKIIFKWTKKRELNFLKKENRNRVCVRIKRRDPYPWGTYSRILISPFWHRQPSKLLSPLPKLHLNPF